MDGLVTIPAPFAAPFAVPSIAAESGSKARLSEHTDVRVRAGPLEARSAGASRAFARCGEAHLAPASDRTRMCGLDIAPGMAACSKADVNQNAAAGA
jgi:hypothetical protein